MLVFQFKPYTAFHVLLKVVPSEQFEPETLSLLWEVEEQNKLDSIESSYKGKRYMFPKPPYVKVGIEGVEGKAKMRFKGDYMRHLTKKEWSFRLKIKNDSVFNRYKKLNFHHPGERLGINEYVFQKHMKLRGHLALDYDFAYVVRNKKDTVLYAHEECIGKSYLKKRGLNGVVLRFDEAPFFNWMMYHIPDSFPPSLMNPFLDSAEVLAVGKIKKDKKSLFIEAKQKLLDWRSGRLNTSEVFKMHKTADFLALIDAWGAHHVIGLNNLKFYYDDQERKFEIIASDGNSKLSSCVLSESKFKVHNVFFKDDEFKKEYLAHLKHYSTGKDVSSFLVRNISEIKGRMILLKKEYPNIDNNLAYLHHNFELAEEGAKK